MSTASPRAAAAPTFAGQTLRLADWYVRLKDGEPEAVINESYQLWRVDAQGQVDALAAPADAGWPTQAERELMQALLFAPAAAAV